MVTWFLHIVSYNPQIFPAAIRRNWRIFAAAQEFNCQVGATTETELKDGMVARSLMKKDMLKKGQATCQMRYVICLESKMGIPWDSPTDGISFTL